MEACADGCSAAVAVGDDGAATWDQKLQAGPPVVKGDFSHPVYKKLAQINSEINKMSKEQILKSLQDLRLDTRGTKNVMMKRLKSYFKRKKLAQNNIATEQQTSKLQYILVIDFEATCEAKAPATYKHEIIEFPIVVVNCLTKTVEDSYCSYVRPTLHRRLSAFCTELTGITQEMVDKAPTFPDVLLDVERWLRDRQLIGDPAAKGKVAVATDGPWDVCRFLYGQCKLSCMPVPKWARRWINIRKLYSTFYDCRFAGGLQGMLQALGLSFEGRPHCGLDDARNIARIALHLLSDGCVLRVNEYLYDCRRREAALARRAGQVQASGDASDNGDDDDHLNGEGDDSSDEDGRSDERAQNHSEEHRGAKVELPCPSSDAEDPPRDGSAEHSANCLVETVVTQLNVG